MRLVIVALLPAVLACSDGPAAPAPRAGVVQATPSLTFQPGQTTVGVNGTITWEFGAVPHNVTFTATPGRPADIAGFNTDTAVTRTFTTAGTFAYECTIHPGMRGTVIASAGNPPPPYPAAGRRLAADRRAVAIGDNLNVLASLRGLTGPRSSAVPSRGA